MVQKDEAFVGVCSPVWSPVVVQGSCSPFLLVMLRCGGLEWPGVWDSPCLWGQRCVCVCVS